MFVDVWRACRLRLRAEHVDTSPERVYGLGMAATVGKTITKVWLDGKPVDLEKPARLEVNLDTGRWQVIARPVENPFAKQWRIAAELDDGVIVRGPCTLAWTPDSGDERLFEGIGRPDEWPQESNSLRSP